MADEFNDQSVSENHSIRSGLHLIKENEALNFLTKWKKPDKKTFRESTIGIVLATDMARCRRHSQSRCSAPLLRRISRPVCDCNASTPSKPHIQGIPGNQCNRPPRKNHLGFSLAL